MENSIVVETLAAVPFLVDEADELAASFGVPLDRRCLALLRPTLVWEDGGTM
jgi:hypothetical protein